jgi:hypothetical protein
MISEVRYGGAGRTLSELLDCTEAELDRADPLEIDLAVARSIDGCRALQPGRYAAGLDEWAAQVRSETDRHLYRFQQAPGDYKNSLAYFKALVLATVVGQGGGTGT